MEHPSHLEKVILMTRIVAVANQKGGVGKTTTSVNLSAAIAIQGKSVLLIDLDPQGNATSGVGIDPRSLQKSIYTCLIGQAKPEEVVQSTDIKGLSVIPANSDLAGAEVELVGLDGREHYLREAIQSIQADYDVIILDCPPALGILTINALAAANSVLIPVQCEYYALEGLTRLIESIERVQTLINPNLSIEGIVLTMFDARNSLARQVSEQVRGHFGNKVYQSVIPRNVTLAEAPSYGRPGLLYNMASSGSQAYLSLAKEFLAHGEKSAR